MALPPVIRVLRINSLFHIVRAAGLQGSFSSLHPVSEETPPSAAIRKSRRETFMRQLFLKAAAALALFGVAAAPGIAAAQAKTYDLQSVFGLQVQIGRAAWRGRVCQYVSISVGRVSIKKNKKDLKY